MEKKIVSFLFSTRLMALLFLGFAVAMATGTFIESKYNTFYSYWSRVNRQREDGPYARDVFKAAMHEKAMAEEARAQTSVGAAERGMGQIFNTYKDALEQATGRKHEIDFDAFQRSLIARAKDIKEKHGVKKVSFKVKVHEGKVTVQAVGKNE